MSREDDLGHGDIEAALATRRELGARYDAELVDGFAERIERAVDRRVADQVALAAAAYGGRWRAAGVRQFALGIISLGGVHPDHASCPWSSTDNGPARGGDRVARHRRRQRRPRVRSQRRDA